MLSPPFYGTDSFFAISFESIVKDVTPDVFGCDVLDVGKVLTSEHSAIHAISITWIAYVFIITYDVPEIK